MPHGDNPAARLRQFMEELNARGGGSQETSKPATPTIAGMFYLPYPDDAATLWARLADVADLVRETRAVADSLPPSVTEVRMRNFNVVEDTVKSFGAVMNMTVWGLLEPMRPHGWHTLELADDLLRQYAREPVLGDDVVRGLIKETRELADAIREADELPPNGRRWLLDRLEEIENALTDVSLFGYGGVERDIERLGGGLLRSAERVEGVRRSGIKNQLFRFIVGVGQPERWPASGLPPARTCSARPGRAESPSGTQPCGRRTARSS